MKMCGKECTLVSEQNLSFKINKKNWILHWLTVFITFTFLFLQMVWFLHPRREISNDFSPSSSVTSMLNDLKWDNIENRRTTQRLATLHKILHEEIDIPHHNYIQSKPQRSRRTHNKQFNLTNCTSTPFAQSFFPETIKLWNSLPQSTVDVKLNTKFKEIVSKH